MTEEKKRKTLPVQITFIKTENGYVGGNKQSCEILEALPENVVIFFEDDEPDEVNKQGPHGLGIEGVSFKDLTIDGYFLLAKEITRSVLDKTKIPKHFMDNIWGGNSQNFPALAFILRGHLSVLRQAKADSRNKKSTVAPVLGKKLLSHSEMSYVAYQMLATALSETEHEYLIELIGVLLDVDLAENRLLKNIDEREKAEWILAQRPEFSTRQVAAEIGVNHTTVSRWLKESDAIHKVMGLREIQKSLKAKQTISSKDKKSKD